MRHFYKEMGRDGLFYGHLWGPTDYLRVAARELLSGASLTAYAIWLLLLWTAPTSPVALTLFLVGWVIGALIIMVLRAGPYLGDAYVAGAIGSMRLSREDERELRFWLEELPSDSRVPIVGRDWDTLRDITYSDLATIVEDVNRQLSQASEAPSTSSHTSVA